MNTPTHGMEKDVCPIQKGADCGCTGPKLPWTFLGGFIGTVAMTLMMYLVAPTMGLSIDSAPMLGSILGGSWWTGMAMLVVSGTVIFPLIYAFFLHGVLPGSNAIKGITWGIIIWLLAQTIVMPLLGAGFFSANVGGAMAAMGSFIAFLVYGFLLGWVAGSTEPKTA